MITNLKIENTLSKLLSDFCITFFLSAAYSPNTSTVPYLPQTLPSSPGTSSPFKYAWWPTNNSTRFLYPHGPIFLFTGLPISSCSFFLALLCDRRWTFIVFRGIKWNKPAQWRFLVGCRRLLTCPSRLRCWCSPECRQRFERRARNAGPLGNFQSKIQDFMERIK